MALVRVLYPSFGSANAHLASDGVCEPPNGRTIQLLLQLHLRMLAIRLLDRLDRLACAIFRGKRAFEHVDEVRWYLSKTNGD